MKRLVSLILPVYNADKYLRDCIQSILEQTYPNFELIIVDDGSTDKTSEICKDFAERDPRIRYYRQINRGVSSARNFALTKAYGEYVGFVDSDDIVDQDMYRELVRISDRYRTDITICRYKEFLETPDLAGRDRKKPIIEMFNAETAAYQMLTGDKFEGHVWTKLIRRSVLSGLEFNPDLVICEDEVFMLQVLKRSVQIAFIPGEYYYYRVHHGAATRRAFYPKFASVIDAREILYRECGNLRRKTQRVALKKIFLSILLVENQILASNISSDYWDNYIQRKLKKYYPLYFNTVKKLFSFTEGMSLRLLYYFPQVYKVFRKGVQLFR